MGTAAKYGFEDLACHLSGTMHACAIIKDPNSNQYYRNDIRSDRLYARYDKTSTPHVEVQLFMKIKDIFKNFKDIPNQSTIVIASRWSPCQQCVASDIPYFLSQIPLQEKNLRVKFRFDNHYSKDDWKFDGQYHLWPSNLEAQQAYDALAKQYPVAKMHETFWPEYNAVVQKESWSVVFAPRTQEKTSKRYEFTV